MGAAAAPIAAVSSIASIGFSLAGSESKAEGMETQAQGEVMRGQGQQAADEFQAAQAQRAAEFGRTQAQLTDTTMREQLNTTLDNIQAIRAGGNVDPSSPTTGALEDWNREVSNRQRLAAVVSQRSQADEEDASAKYLRQAGQFAVAQANVAASAIRQGANATRLSGIATALGSAGKGLGSGSFGVG